ncbi:MAG: beta-propeller fold lactonase family protein [Acidimicrobiia bacterium]
MRIPTRWQVAATLASVVVLASACSSGGDGGDAQSDSGNDPETSVDASNPDVTDSDGANDPAKPANVYEHTQADDVADSVADIPTRVYVPNGESNTVSVIDPVTFEVIDQYPVGQLPQHVVPSHDMQALYVTNNIGNTLTPIDPRTGQPGESFPVDVPYNLYFTPDGTRAVVIAERNSQVDFRDPTTWELIKRVDIPPEQRDEDGDSGVNHAEFTADGKTMIASCEFSGWLVRFDLDTMEITGAVDIGGKPVDVKLSPDGTVVYIANETRNGVHVVDWANMQELAFIPTGEGTHGLYPSRDATLLYASNRIGGSVSVIDFASRQVVDTWTFGGSPDMGGVSTDGSQLWLSGRYHSEVYVIDTTTGELIRRIPVGSGPHGLALFPQPGRYSMGHTGNYR